MNDDELVEKLEKEVMPKHAAALEKAAGEIKDQPIEVFNAAVNILVKQILAEFLALTGAGSTAEWSAKLKTSFTVYIVSLFNEKLPTDYPYIVFAARIEDENTTVFGSMKRKTIPGAHEMTTSGVVPFVYVKSRGVLMNPATRIHAEWMHSDTENPNPA